MKLNNDLGKISEWARQWKMSFNPDITKQAIEVTFSKKVLPSNLPQLLFNNFVVLNQDVHKHLGLILGPLIIIWKKKSLKPIEV